MKKGDWLKHLGFATSAAITISSLSKKPTNMTDEDYKQLEHLLGMLSNEIGGKICIIPGYLHDGYHIGMFDSKSGTPIKSATGPTIKDTVRQLNLTQTTNEH